MACINVTQRRASQVPITQLKCGRMPQQTPQWAHICGLPYLQPRSVVSVAPAAKRNHIHPSCPSLTASTHSQQCHAPLPLPAWNVGSHGRGITPLSSCILQTRSRKFQPRHCECQSARQFKRLCRTDSLFGGRVDITSPLQHTGW